MPRVNRVNKARKDQGTCGNCGVLISRGDEYVWWKFRWSGRYVRCGKSECYPRASDLTQSEYYATMAEHESTLNELAVNADIDSDTADDLRSLADEIEDYGQEQSERRNNMPYQLQDAEAGELLQTRAEACENLANELRNAADEVESELSEAIEEFDLKQEDDLKRVTEALGEDMPSRDDYDTDEDWHEAIAEAVSIHNSNVVEAIGLIIENVSWEIE